jgi:hypothetical protein
LNQEEEVLRSKASQASSLRAQKASARLESSSKRCTTPREPDLEVVVVDRAAGIKETSREVDPVDPTARVVRDRTAEEKPLKKERETPRADSCPKRKVKVDREVNPDPRVAVEEIEVDPREAVEDLKEDDPAVEVAREAARDKEAVVDRGDRAADPEARVAVADLEAKEDKADPEAAEVALRAALKEIKEAVVVKEVKEAATEETRMEDVTTARTETETN